jgi:HEAT repeat protein
MNARVPGASRIARAVAVCGLLASLPSAAQEPLTEAAEELVRRERVRAEVEQAFALFKRDAPSGAQHLDDAIAAVEMLVKIGAEAVPYLVNEAEQERRETYDFAVYALGMIQNPESEQALRDAMARAEGTAGMDSLVRKAWAGWALALHGEPDAVVLLDQGRHKAGHWAVHANCSVLEAAALQVGPESVPLLLQQLQPLGEQGEVTLENRWALRALRRLADDRAVPALLTLARDANHGIRHEAVHALGTMGTREATEALDRALDDEDEAVRRAAVVGLERRRIALDAERLLRRLDVETDPVTRGGLYRLIEAHGSPAQRERLSAHWGRDAARDRQLLVEAIGRRGDESVLPIVELALEDGSNGVILAAVDALAALGTPRAEDRLVQELTDANWLAVQVVADHVGRLRITRAGAPATERMLAAATVTEGRDAANAEHAAAKLGRALVALRHHAAARKLRRAADEPSSLGAPADPRILAIFRSTADTLDRIRTSGAKVEAWAAELGSPDDDRRHLAYHMLAELESASAIEALVGAFDAATPADREVILEELVDVDLPAARALVQRVLLDPAFDPPPQAGQRDWAAWAARRLGDGPMQRLLAQAVDRRNGRDARVLVYAALAEGPAGAERIVRYERVRMRYLGQARGREQERLAWLARYLRAGQPLDEFDLPPPKLVFF